MKSVDRSDRKLSLRGEILRAGVFSKSNESSGGPATACHPGARGPSTANALGRGHSPENHPDSLPNNITNGGEAREDSRGQTFVAGRSFGEIAEGAEAQPTPPMNKADAWPPMGPPFGPRRNTVPMRKQKRGTGTAGTPRKGRVRKPEKAPAPNHPLPIPRDPPDRDHPYALRHQAPARTRQTGCIPKTQSIAEVSGPRPKMSSRGSLPLTEQPSGGFESATGEIWGGTAGPFPPALKIDAIPPTRSTDRDQRRDRPRFRCPSAPRPCPWQPTFNEGLSTRSTR
jgi:hypothetical protein